MAKTWEQEKAYSAKRAVKAVEAMEKAIASADLKQFQDAWQLAMRYMNVKDRRPYYLRMLQAAAEKEGATV